MLIVIVTVGMENYLPFTHVHLLEIKTSATNFKGRFRYFL